MDKLAGGGFETGIQNAGEGISQGFERCEDEAGECIRHRAEGVFQNVPFYGELIWFLILKIELRVWDDAPRCS